MNKNIFKAIIILLIINVSTSSTINAQENIENNRLKLEIEPGLFFTNGRSVNFLYNVTKKNNFGIGLYLMTTEIPDNIAKNMFNNLEDNTSAKVTQEYALNLRYRFKVFKNSESNPYVGLLLGWENIRLTTPTFTDLDVSTMIGTPHVGYEIYVYKKMLYLNPQIRSVFYFGQNYSDKKRKESLKSFLILPSITVGLRI